MSQFKTDKEQITGIHKSNKLHIFYALLTASVLMFVFGFGYHVLAAKLSSDTGNLSIDPNTLKKFPMKIGDWTGTEVPIDEKIIRATDTDAHISRNYSQQNGLDSVWFYVACGVKARDLMPHRPEVCYIGAGWTLAESQPMDFQIDKVQTLPVTIIEFKRGVLKNERIIVLDYYIVDGKYCRDVSMLRLKAWHGSGSVGYVGQVQIVAGVSSNTDKDSIEKNICSFAVESAPFLSDILRKAEINNSSDNVDDSSGENHG